MNWARLFYHEEWAALDFTNCIKEQSELAKIICLVRVPLGNPMDCTIVISSKDRKEELKKCLTNCLLQEGSPEILVIDDCSQDGTQRMIETEFPMVKVHRLESNIGLINARNLAASLVGTTYICSIDDDAWFAANDIVKTNLHRIQKNDKAIAVALPVVQVHEGNRLLQWCEKNKEMEIRQFIGTAYLVDRNKFLELGGFPSYLFRQEEELHFGVEAFIKGYGILKGWGDPIFHNESSKRDEKRIRFYEARNLMLFILRYTPLPLIPVHVTGNFINLSRTNPRLLSVILNGYWNAILTFTQGKCPRTPLGFTQYYRFRQLSDTLEKR